MLPWRVVGGARCDRWDRARWGRVWSQQSRAGTSVDKSRSNKSNRCNRSNKVVGEVLPWRVIGRARCDRWGARSGGIEYGASGVELGLV